MWHMESGMNFDVLIVFGIALSLSISIYVMREMATERGHYGPDYHTTALWRWIRRKFFGVHLPGPRDRDG